MVFFALQHKMHLHFSNTILSIIADNTTDRRHIVICKQTDFDSSNVKQRQTVNGYMQTRLASPRGLRGRNFNVPAIHLLISALYMCACGLFILFVFAYLSYL